MRILEFPKPVKVPKKNFDLNIKVKCENCGTVLLIDDIGDIRYTNCSFEGDSKTPSFDVICPYCESRIYFEYRKCKKIRKWMDATGVKLTGLTNTFDQYLALIKNSNWE